MLRLTIGRAALVVAPMLGGAVAVACGSAANSAGFAGPGDAGTGYDSAGDDSSALGDSSFGDGSDAGLPPTTAIVVLGSRSLPNARVCWKIGGVMSSAVPFPSSPMPASNYAGIPVGGAALLADASPLSSGDVELYAIDAYHLAIVDQSFAQQNQPEPTCRDLICSGSNMTPCLTPNTDYHPAGTLAQGAIQPGRTSVIAIGGCLATAFDSNATAASCGSTWDAVQGNVHAEVLQVASFPEGDAGAFAVQAAQLSPGLATLATSGGSAVITFGEADAGDAGATTVVTTLSSEGAVAPAMPATLALASGLATYGQVGFAVDVHGVDAGATHLWMSLIESQELVDPAADPTQYFGQPKTYVLAVVGDPFAGQPYGASGYDGTGLHLLVLPSP